ncbi:MAG: hypothetical protein P8R54_26315 [Myxococcota bacterium]|nr:hypothetical protein [Myxococcota bacterium]
MHDSTPSLSSSSGAPRSTAREGGSAQVAALTDGKEGDGEFGMLLSRRDPPDHPV